MTDPFERWGLLDTASEQEIKRMYRKRVQHMHPDRAGNSPEVLADFLQLQEDYVLLKDPQQRRLLIQSRQQATRARQILSTPNNEQEVADLFAQTEHIPSSNLKVHMSIPLATVWSGGKAEQVVEVGEPCGCGRSKLCPYCKGSGQVFTKKMARVKIPAGVLPGQFLTIPQQGHKGSVSQGDLIVIVKWSHTHGWTWNGQLLEHEITVPRWMFKSGKSIALRSPSGVWGTIDLPKFNPKKNTITLQIPNMGLPQKGSEKRNPASIIVHRAPWFAPWKGLLAQWNHK